MLSPARRRLKRLLRHAMRPGAPMAVRFTEWMDAVVPGWRKP